MIDKLTDQIDRSSDMKNIQITFMRTLERMVSKLTAIVWILENHSLHPAILDDYLIIMCLIVCCLDHGQLDGSWLLDCQRKPKNRLNWIDCDSKVDQRTSRWTIVWCDSKVDQRTSRWKIVWYNLINNWNGNQSSTIANRDQQIDLRSIDRMYLS